MTNKTSEEKQIPKHYIEKINNEGKVMVKVSNK